MKISEEFLQPTYFIDSDSKIVVSLAEKITEKTENDVIEKAKAIFYWTRDEILYDPYDSLYMARKRYKASSIMTQKKGWCVQKACVLAALARAIQIPSRLHFVDIRNHATPEKLMERMGTDLFVYHGYAELFLNGKWIKATPAFNITLCEKFGLKTAEFDGENDGMLPETTLNGEKHIEYVKDRGISADIPLKKIFKTFGELYNLDKWN